jgi:receptor protein-tyrosine kinase
MNGSVDLSVQYASNQLSRVTQTGLARDQPLGLILKEAGLLNDEEIDRIVCHARASGMRFGEAAIALGLVRPEDLKTILAYQFDLPLVIPGEHRIDREVIAAHESFHPVLDDLRELRDQLMLRWSALGPSEPRTVALIGVARAEGRSFLAANLAVVFAQTGLEVLLIDADMRRGRLHRMFGLDGSAGLSTILSGRPSAGAKIQIEPMRSLSLIPCGGEPPNAADLLVGPRFGELLRHAAELHQVIILDTPAASEAPELLAISARVDGNVLVARRGSSRAKAVQALVKSITDVGGKLVGSVLSGA